MLKNVVSKTTLHTSYWMLCPTILKHNSHWHKEFCDTNWSFPCVISSIMFHILFHKASKPYGLFLQTLFFKFPHRPKLHIFKTGECGIESYLFIKTDQSTRTEFSVVCWCTVLLKICAILFSYSYFYKECLLIFIHIFFWINCVMKAWKNKELEILVIFTAHHVPPVWLCNGIWVITCDFQYPNAVIRFFPFNIIVKRKQALFSAIPHLASTQAQWMLTANSSHKHAATDENELCTYYQGRVCLYWCISHCMLTTDWLYNCSNKAPNCWLNLSLSVSLFSLSFTYRCYNELILLSWHSAL
jgi:hypothetical protein